MHIHKDTPTRTYTNIHTNTHALNPHAEITSLVKVEKLKPIQLTVYLVG